MNFRDLKYLLAFTLPGLALLCALNPQAYYFQTFKVGMVLVPILDFIIPPHAANPSNETSRSSVLFFDFLLYLNFPLLFVILFLGLGSMTNEDLTLIQTIFCVLSFGVLLGTSGLNVAHEIGHRNGELSQWISRLMLTPASYVHFNIDHYFGHHKNVGTEADPVTASKGQWVYAFWIQSIFGGYRGAWKHENKRIKTAGLAMWKNKMIWFHILMISYQILVFGLFGLEGFIYGLLIGLVAVLLVETANYVEHYGMRRKKLSNGRYEPVQIHHSWNSDREIGRILLFELTRHSDHHDKATRKYQNLKSHKEAPALPINLVASLFVALIPPLWFKLMDHRIPA